LNAAFPRSTATLKKERAMKKLKVTGSPPRPLPTAALLGLALVTPALIGCPGHLENIGFLGGDAGVNVTPQPPPAPVYLDAAAPIPLPPPPVAVDAAAPPAADNIPPPGDDTSFDPATCFQAGEVLRIFKSNCVGCHSGAMPPAGLDLLTMGAKGRMLNVQAKNAACAGKPLLAADGTGVFVDKITGMMCGMQMPRMKAPLSAKLQKCLTDWVKPAAPPPAAAIDPKTCFQGMEIVKNILTPKCATCHKAVMGAAGLDLESMGAKARLNMGARNAMCMGKPLANLADGSGVIIDKITGAACGNRMPFNKPPLNDQEIWCMKEWLRQGSAGPFPPQPTVTVLPPGGVQQPPAQALACAQPAAIQTLFQQRCNVCHSAVMKAGQLDLESPGVKARVVGARARNPGMCVGRVLMDQNGGGFFIEKLTLTFPLGCGQGMPYGGFAPLSADEVNCIKEWAKN